jgi:hypothetical protein
MKARAPNQIERDEPAIIELDGPPQAYFEIPLDYWATPNGELEAESHPEASRLVQRVVYINFKVGPRAADMIIEKVKTRLKELGGGYIWWRLRPTATQDDAVRFRLGTTPQLPGVWWEALSVNSGNGSLDKNVPGMPY